MRPQMLGHEEAAIFFHCTVYYFVKKILRMQHCVHGFSALLVWGGENFDWAGVCFLLFLLYSALVG